MVDAVGQSFTPEWPPVNATPTAPRRRNGWKIGLFGLCATIAAGAVTVQIDPGLLESNSYAGTSSIERDPEFRDPRLMEAAQRQPVAIAYARAPYEFQRNQSLCGPTSVADVLHSLGDPRSQESLLAAAPHVTLFGYIPGGLTLDEEAELMRRAVQRPVAMLRDLTLEQFRVEMRAVNDPGLRYVVNFHRGPLFGRGHGHFSPLLAYLPTEDLVLVGDVNANYRPFLVSTYRLYRAVDTVDTATGKKRGLLRMSAELPGQVHRADKERL